MSTTRQHRILGQVERIGVSFDLHAGGLTRRELSDETDIPEGSLPHLLSRMRTMASEIGHIPFVLKIGREWIYGWADTMKQHHEEHLKRRRNERRRVRIDAKMLEESAREHPDDEVIRDQLRSSRHRLEDLDAQIESLAGIVSQLREAMV